MSQVSIQGNASGTGTFTIAAPNSNSNRTLTLPDSTGTILTNNDTATTATNLAGGGAGQVPYQSASGTTAMLAAGTSGQILQSNGAAAPSWITPSSGGVTSLNGQTGAITDTTLYAIGSYVTGSSASTSTNSADSTLAGTSLRLWGGIGQNNGCGGLLWKTAVGDSNTYSPSSVNVGTWRCMTPSQMGNPYKNMGLWVRIS